MVDMNVVIAQNINDYLNKNNKKQIDLANALGVSRQIVSKMLNGIRTINAIELRQIAEFCETSMENLTTIPENYEEMDVLHVFMGEVKTEEAREAIKDIDKMIDLILFYNQLKENGQEAMEEWSDF